MSTPDLYDLVCRMAGWSSAHGIELVIQPVQVFHVNGRPTGEKPGQFTYFALIEIAGTGTKVQGASRDGIDGALLALGEVILGSFAAGQRYNQERREAAEKLYKAHKEAKK